MVRNIKAGLIILLMTIVVQLHAETAQKIFVHAGRAYNLGNFKKALEKYQAMNEKGPGVLFNMGNCFFALQKYPQAVVAFKRARRGAPSALLKEIDQHMQASYEQLGRQNDPNWFLSTIEPWAYIFSPFLYQFLFLIIWYALWLVIIRRRKIRFYLFFLITFSLLLTFLGSTLLVHYDAHIYTKGIVIKESKLLAGPHEQYDALKELSLLEDVRITETRKGWYKVATQNHTGWVPTRFIETV